MDARTAARLKVSRQALLALRSRDFRNEFSDANSAGDHVFIPALLDDTMDQLLDQFRAADGPVYVVTPDDNGLTILSFTATHRPKHAAPDDEACPIYGTTELGMVISVLKASKSPVTFYEAPVNVLLQLVEDGAVSAGI